jgi:murein DD-endopeptidase MepM/ murein hydrolase activator NlpD
MGVRELIQRILNKLKNQYRLTIFNDSTFQSVFSIKLTRLKVFAAVAIASSVIVMLVTFLIAATPLREYIPGYPDAEQRQMMVNNVIKIDSLEVELDKRDAFFESIKAVVSGNVPVDTISGNDSARQLLNVKFNNYNHDSIFEDELLAEQTNVSIRGNNTNRKELSQMHFFVPLKGIVTNQFNSASQHFGVDLVSEPNARICSVLDGSVIFSGWTLETGYVIYIQHDADLISVYKHNAELLKTTGDRVKAGEPVAIIGNSGEFTSGPHLHLELWHRGNPVDPQQYIDF